MAQLLAEILPTAERLRVEALRLEESIGDWEVLAEQEGVIGHVSPDRLTVRSQGEIAVGIATVYSFVNDWEKMGRWTVAAERQEVLMSLDSNTDIVHRVFQPQGLSPYDFVFFVKRNREANSSLTQVGRSIEFKGMPKLEQGHVRAEMINVSFVLRKLSDSTTRVTFINSIDPKSHIAPDVLRTIQVEDSLTVLRIRRELLSEDFTHRSTARSERTKELTSETRMDEGEVLVEKLDEEFFRSLLAQVHSGQDLPSGEKFEIYLSERLLPALLPGMEALSKETERFMMQKEKIDPRVRSRFNPVVWLAEYLMRNNPNHIPLQPEVANNFSSQVYLQKAKRFY